MTIIFLSFSQEFHLPVYDVDTHQQMAKLESSLNNLRARDEHWSRKKEKISPLFARRIMQRIDAVLKENGERHLEKTLEYYSLERNLQLGQLNITHSYDRFKRESITYFFTPTDDFFPIPIDGKAFDLQNRKYALITKSGLNKLVERHKYRPSYI